MAFAQRKDALLNLLADRHRSIILADCRPSIVF